MHDDRLVWRRAAVTCSLLGALAALMLLRPVAA